MYSGGWKGSFVRGGRCFSHVMYCYCTMTFIHGGCVGLALCISVSYTLLCMMMIRPCMTCNLYSRSAPISIVVVLNHHALIYTFHQWHSRHPSQSQTSFGRRLHTQASKFPLHPSFPIFPAFSSPFQGRKTHKFSTPTPQTRSPSHPCDGRVKKIDKSPLLIMQFPTCS